MNVRKYLLLLLLAAIGFAGCSSTGKVKYHTTVVKPKYHHRFYDRKKDKRTKRVQSVKVQN
jgi:hypothetical protein